jgi:hypothetical protein
MHFGGKACAAVGQSGLMAIYDTLFSQVSLLCSDEFLYRGSKGQCYPVANGTYLFVA